MTKEEKQILLQDLCMRLSYGVKVCVGTQYDIDNDITDIALLRGLEFDNPTFGVKALVCAKTHNGSNTFGTDIEEIKPYLRPISSMTEEEAEELDEMNIYNKPIAFYNRLGEEPYFYMECNVINVIEAMQYIDWLNAHHFDYRGLIPMGLALKAPEGMYD